MHRAYLSVAASGVSFRSDSELYGELALKLPFAVEPAQRAAWEYEIQHLRLLARDLPDAHFMFEFLIPRMGRRADLIVLLGGVVFVVEYKIGARHFERSGLDQVYGYGLDLKHFHEPSHRLPVVPILVATETPLGEDETLHWHEDGLARPLRVAPVRLAPLIAQIAGTAARPQIGDCQDFRVWAGIMGKKESHYVPTQGTGDTG